MSFTVEWAEKVHVWQLGIARERLAVGTHAQTEAEGPVSHRAERARRAKRALKLKVAEPFRLVSSPSLCLPLLPVFRLSVVRVLSSDPQRDRAGRLCATPVKCIGSYD